MFIIREHVNYIFASRSSKLVKRSTVLLNLCNQLKLIEILVTEKKYFNIRSGDCCISYEFGKPIAIYEMT